jgi:hypothetical protein
MASIQWVEKKELEDQTVVQFDEYIKKRKPFKNF